MQRENKPLQSAATAKQNVSVFAADVETRAARTEQKIIVARVPI
jgi:hypothetical protein